MNKEFLKLIPAINSSGSRGVNSIFSCTGDFTLPLQLRICFGQFTKHFTGDKTVDVMVRMFREPEKTGGCYTNAYAITPFTNDEIIQYLNDLRKIFPFEFELNESIAAPGNNNYRVFPERISQKRECIDVTYHISGPHIVFMFILSLQRFLYAWPDSYPLALAFDIKNGGYGFDKMNLFNILNCAISTLAGGSRGGDMFHFNCSRFMYLYNSVDLREMLLAREAKAKDYGNACIDLYYSMIYVDNPNLKRLGIGNWTNFLGYTDCSYTLEDIIKTIIGNLTELRKYNGFSEEARRRRALIEERKKEVSSDHCNFYNDNSEQDPASRLKVDESRLTT